MASVSRTVLHNTFLTLPPSASDFDFMEDLPLPPEMVDWDSYNISDCSESPRINGVRPERSHPSVRFTLSDAELLGFPVSFSPVIPESESQEEFGKGTGGIFCRLEDEEPTEDKTEESVPEAAGPSASTRESSHPSTPSAGSSPSSSFNEGDDDTPDSSMDAICTPPLRDGLYS